MPRNNRPKRSRGKAQEDHVDLTGARFGFRRTEVKRGITYTVQSTPGHHEDSNKSWTCPHCFIEIRVGTAHIVAWDEVGGLDRRRHFHSGCWSKFQGPLT